MKRYSIALDGPAGAGKSTLAKRAAKHFGFIYVDTGALYRCIGLYVLRNGVHPKNEAGVEALLPEIELEMKYDEDGVQRMLLCGEDVTNDIRTPEISAYASDVSALPPVRAFLLSMQREMAERYNVIMDGRDIGTVVLPDAGLKVFLSADIEARAQRRYIELLDSDNDIKYEDVLRDIEIRDRNDSERAAAPLKAADDAVLLDTTRLDLDESLEALCKLISGRFMI